ncbi:MAG: HAMP domain-containing protein [Deltaproteobacteria bacterium]|nr:HAMP domain-containing protein [Deltaproteobacteria bacterium]
MKLKNHTLFRRRQYVINKDFQFRYIGLLVGLASLLCLVFIVMTKHYIELNLNPLIESGMIASPVVNELIQIEKQFLNKNLLTVFLLVLGPLTLAGIFITHRIAGPIYALERRMKQIAQEGMQNTPFHIRRTDEFQELVESFNDMMASLQKQMDQQNQKIKMLEGGQEHEATQKARESLKKVA